MATTDNWDRIDNTYRPTFDPWPGQPRSCFCACLVCMSGQCCMDPNRWTPPTYVGTGTDIGIGVHHHSWQAVGLRKGDVIQSCSCGEVRRVPVP